MDREQSGTPTRIGHWLRHTRQQRAYSLRELEALSGVSDSTIHRIESGQAECDLASFVLICEALGELPGEVLEDVFRPSPLDYEKGMLNDPIAAQFLVECGAACMKEMHVGRLNLQLAVAAAAWIVLAARPQRVAGLMDFPSPEIAMGYSRFADRLEANRLTSLDRAAVLQNFARQGFQEFLRLGVVSKSVLRPSVQTDIRSFREFLGGNRAKAVGIWLLVDAENEAAQTRLQSPWGGEVFDYVKDSLTKYLPDPNLIPDVRKRESMLGFLRARLLRATSERGAKAALAKEFGVSRQAVNAWLSGASAPEAETTLRLLEWVTADEAKKQGVGSGSTPPAPETRVRRFKHEKPTSGPKKQ